MTWEETLKVLSVMRAAYPQFYKNSDVSEASSIATLWSEMFDEPYALVAQAVKALACTLKFPPTIADVKEKIALIAQPEHLSEFEAWNLIRKAVSYYNAVENYQALPPILQKLVGSPNQLREWAMLDPEVLNSVIQSNLIRSYTAKVKAQKEMDALPESTKQFIQAISSGNDFVFLKKLNEGVST